MMYPYHGRMSSHNEIYIESTVAGILQIETLTDMDSNSEDSTGEDSKIDETWKFVS
jgi:hypothetical protein